MICGSIQNDPFGKSSTGPASKAVLGASSHYIGDACIQKCRFNQRGDFGNLLADSGLPTLNLTQPPRSQFQEPYTLVWIPLGALDSRKLALGGKSNIPSGLGIRNVLPAGFLGRASSMSVLEIPLLAPTHLPRAAMESRATLLATALSGGCR
jgi:hypothetical protein